MRTAKKIKAGSDFVIGIDTGGAQDFDRTIVHRIAHPRAASRTKIEVRPYLRSANKDLNGMSRGIQIGDAEALIHGSGSEVVIPGETILVGGLLFGQSHHL